MDNLNELGKVLEKNASDTQSALTRNYLHIPVIERVRDVFDSLIPFEMEFKIEKNYSQIDLSLIFNQPPAQDTTNCCGGIYCGNCETFIGTDSILTLSFPIVGGVNVYLNETLITNYTVTNTTTITLAFTPDASDVIKVCYVYQQVLNTFCYTFSISDLYPLFFYSPGSCYFPGGRQPLITDSGHTLSPAGYYTDPVLGGAYINAGAFQQAGQSAYIPNVDTLLNFQFDLQVNFRYQDYYPPIELFAGDCGMAQHDESGYHAWNNISIELHDGASAFRYFNISIAQDGTWSLNSRHNGSAITTLTGTGTPLAVNTDYEVHIRMDNIKHYFSITWGGYFYENTNVATLDVLSSSSLSYIFWHQNSGNYVTFFKRICNVPFYL